MNKHLILLVAGALNVIAFLLHYWVFKKSNYPRKSWALVTMGAGIGAIFYHAPEILWGLETNMQPLWIGIFVFLTGFGLYLLNRFDRRSSSSL